MSLGSLAKQHKPPIRAPSGNHLQGAKERDVAFYRQQISNTADAKSVIGETQLPAHTNPHGLVRRKPPRVHAVVNDGDSIGSESGSPGVMIAQLAGHSQNPIRQLEGKPAEGNPSPWFPCRTIGFMPVLAMNDCAGAD
jgi:hypothetical protein